MVSPLSKPWDVMPVKADHSMELLHRRRELTIGKLVIAWIFLGLE